MNQSLHISDAGIAIEKKYNQGIGFGFAKKAFALAPGVWIIGYGHRILSAGDYLRTAEIDEITACKLLALDNTAAEHAVKRSVTVELSQHEFDALTVLAFSIGARNFCESDLVKMLNAGDTRAAADAFLYWNEFQSASRIVERALFLGVADV